MTRYWELVVEGRQGGNDMLNVIHYQTDGSDVPDWGNVGIVLRGHLVDHIQGISGTTVSYLGFTVREDIPGGVGQFYAFSAGDVVGTSSDSDLAFQLAALVRKHSDGLIRPVRGWAFHGGIVTTRLTINSSWEAGALTAVEDYWEDIREINAVDSPAMLMVIKASNPTAPNTQAYSIVDRVSVATLTKTLKGRATGVGS